MTEPREETLLWWPHTKTNMVLLFCAELRIKLRQRGNYTREMHTWLCLDYLKLKSLLCFLCSCRNAIYNLYTLNIEEVTLNYTVSVEML